MILRPYQSHAVAELEAKIRQNPILVMPTGSGKGAVLAEFVRRRTASGARILFLAHRRELIGQLADHLRYMGVESGRILAGVEPSPHHQVQVASVQTLGRRTHPPADIVISDECHHCSSDGWKKLLGLYPNAAKLGASATPFRLDGKPLGDIFGAIIVGAYTDELVAQGVLHAPRFFAPKHGGADVSGVATRHGDFATGELADTMNTPQLVGDIVEHWKALASGRLTIGFAVTIEHSLSIVERFRQAGIAAEHLDGAMPIVEREGVLRRWRSRETLIVFNCMVTTEGFDFPELEVEIVARPTKSLCLHLQMLGRVMRTAADKRVCLVLDHAGNIHRHGSPMSRLKYSLTQGVEREVDDAVGNVRAKTCKACGCVTAMTATECPQCGQAFPKRKPPVEAKGSLQEVVAPRADAPFSERKDYWSFVEGVRKANAYSPGYSLARYKYRFGAFPIVIDDQLVDPNDAPSTPAHLKKADYHKLLATAAAKGKSTGWAAFLFQQRYKHFPPKQWKEEWQAQRIGSQGGTG